MYVNGKMISVETIPGMGEGGMKENGGRGEFMSDIFDIRTFVNATMYPNPTQYEKQKHISSLNLSESSCVYFMHNV
jgi:hypothetical protein